MNLSNHFLIATPNMLDPRFQKAVILICEHNQSGALGINLNNPSQVQFNEVLKGLELPLIEDKPLAGVYEGGPVNSECGFILYDSPQSYKNTVQVNPQIKLGTSKQILQAIAEQELDGNWLLALGCATWEANQLEREIADNAWLTCPADSALVFHSGDKWALALNLLGVEAYQLSGNYGHA